MSYGNDKSDQIVAKMWYEAKAKRKYLASESFLSLEDPLKKSRARGPCGHKREKRWQE